MPASMLSTGAGIRRHLRPSAACGARVGAAESFVSFIPLFDGPAFYGALDDLRLCHHAKISSRLR